jgi:alkylated DNA repair dioxygenase AlkB
MIEQFKKKGYIHLKGFLDEANCQELTTVLKRLVAEKKTTKDEQCPLSEAIYGTVTFDNLLEGLLPHFEKHCGKKLYPTYSYARLYSPGEELKVHRDRPACEISATVTLGFSGKQWSIYLGDQEDKSNANEIIMNVGDAVIYRGMDKYHWREKFEGEWQAQVFLHYVDADGPYAEWKYDKRESLGNSKNIKQTEQTEQTEHFGDCFKLDNAISNTFCDLLINEYTKPEIIKEPPVIGPIIGCKEGFVDLSIRNTKRVMLIPHSGIGGTLAAIGLNVNNATWQYNITHSNQAEFLIYDIDGKYECHVDTTHQFSNETRKLTVLGFLNNDFEGGKFFIQNSSKKFYPPQNKGTVVVFPSYMPHGVEPITKGIRYSVVSWMLGPYFK